MNALRRWSLGSTSFFVCVLAAAGTACAADIITRPAPARCDGPNCQAIDLFTGIDAGQLEAKLIPRDAKKARVFLTNKTKEPLNVRLPAALAGRVILAQFAPPGGGNGNVFNQGRNGQQVPQTVGITPGGNRNGQQQNNMNFGPGMFNIPAEKVVEFRVDCVCLEYGKPNPRPIVPYELVRAESVASPATVAMLAAFGQGDYSQNAAQAAAWHLANGMSWEKLESLDGQLLSIGVHERRFSKQDIKDAKALVAAAEKAIEKGNEKTPATSVGITAPADASISANTR